MPLLIFFVQLLFIVQHGLALSSSWSVYFPSQLSFLTSCPYHPGLFYHRSCPSFSVCIALWE